MTAHEVPRTLMVEGFRTRRSFGFGGLSKGATIVGAMVLLADGVIGTQAPITLLVTLPLTLAGFGLAAARRPPQCRQTDAEGAAGGGGAPRAEGPRDPRRL
ncbi:hypothetical protein ACFVZQ_10360, partial [Streptomyces sp. NPDC059538]